MSEERENHPEDAGGGVACDHEAVETTQEGGEPTQTQMQTQAKQTATEPPSARQEPPAALANAWFGFLFVATAAGLLYLFRNYVTDVVLGFLLAGLAYPYFVRVKRKVGDRRWLAAGLVTVLLLVAIAIPATFVTVSLYQEAAGLVGSTRKALAAGKVEEFLEGDTFVARTLREGGSFWGMTVTPKQITKSVTDGASTVGKKIYGRVNTVASNLMLATLHFMLVILFIYYGLVDGPRIKAFIFRLSPLPDQDEEVISQSFVRVGKAILLGNGLGSLPQGILGGLAMWAAGLPSPALWGTVMAIFAFLPIVGIMVIVVPATAYLLIKGEVAVGLAFFSFCLAQSLFVENVVKTKLIGSHMRMHSLLIFVAILGGLGTFGVIGLLYGPLLVTLFLTLIDLYEQRYTVRP